MIKYPIGDSHVHPDFSFDGHGTLNEFCEQALKIGLSEITFVPHYEITPAQKYRFGTMVIDGKHLPVSADTVKRYTESARRVAEDYYPSGLQVRIGLEVGWDSTIAEQLANDLAHFDLDFVIGALHEIDGVDILDGENTRAFFQQHSLDYLLEKYFRSQTELVSSGLFNVLAHLDIYKKIGLASFGEKLRTAHKPFISTLFAAMHEHEVGLELNTSGIRHGIGEYYPSFEIVNSARAAGVGVTALGSDAHRLDQLALDFESASLLVHELLPTGLEEGYDY